MCWKRLVTATSLFFILHINSQISYAQGLGCHDIPVGATITCGQMIQNAMRAISNAKSRADSTETKQKRLCRGNKNIKLRKVKNFSAKQIKSSPCLAARNGASATDIIHALSQLGLLDAKSQCSACNPFSSMS